MTTRWILAAALACLAPPAHAAPVADTGRACGVTATGLVDNHLGHETGVIYGGPWLVADDVTVTVTCELEFANPGCYETAGAFYRITSDPRPRAGVLPPVPLEFWNPFQQPIFLGTTIRWTYADGSSGVRNVDFDAATPGDQCAVYTWGNEG